MPQSLQVMPAKVIFPEEIQEEAQKVNIFKNVFKPVIILMKIFGMCSDTIPVGNHQHRASSKTIVLLKIYGCITALMMTANSLRIFPVLKLASGYEFHFQITIIIWSMRCAFQAIYLLLICWPSQNKTSKLVKLIVDLDHGINPTTLKTEKTCLRSFKKSAKINIFLIFSFIATNCVFVYLGFFISDLKARIVLDNMVQPFPATIPLKLFYSVLHVYLSVAWMLPIILYSLICLSLVFMLSILEANIKNIGSDASLRSHMPQIRSMYLKLSDLAGTADDIFGPLALSIYFFDVVQFSFTLYVWLYSAKVFMEKFLTLFWSGSALLNLMFVSFAASSVVEKGKKAADVLQRLETDGSDAKSNAELSLLLFHLSGEPVVMTIWKLIPLYKSIIVSVFISLLTYFTLLLQFK